MRNRSLSRVRRRLRSLAMWELLNIPLQAVVWFGGLGFRPTVPNVVGFALFALLLAQGAGYWFAKLRQLATPGSPLPAERAFRVARVANAPLLLAGVVFVASAVVAEPSASHWLGLGFGLFAVLEHVNYFHTQLSYDNREDLRHLARSGLRRAHLAHDLAKRGPVTAGRGVSPGVAGPGTDNPPGGGVRDRGAPRW